jgi:hypothetical protein
MGGSAKQLKPHNNLPGIGGNSFNPLQNSPGPGIPSPMKMPGMPGGSFNPMDQLRQLPGMGGGGGDQGGGDPAQQQQYINMRAAQENGTETPQMEIQRLMAGMPNLPQQAPAGPQAMAKMPGMPGAAGMPSGGAMGNAGGAVQGGAPMPIDRMMQMAGAAAQAPAAPAGPQFGGPQDLSGTAASGDMMPTRAGGGRKAYAAQMNPQQAAKMAAKLGGGGRG